MRSLLSPRLSALAVFALIFTGCTDPQEGPEPATRPLPNLLLISLDTLRVDHLTSYGYHRDTSPWLDSIASRGVRFRQAFVNTHGTTPSHATMLSSIYQESHRVGYEAGPPGALPSQLPLLQEILRDVGYLTIGVTGGGNVGSKFGFARGFELWNDGSRSAKRGVELLLKALNASSGDERPFFAFYHTYQVHSPYFVPEPYERLYGEFDSNFVPSSENLLKHVDSARADLSVEDLELVRARYDAGIRLTDDTLRGLFSQLETNGWLENTIVVITSDHGEEFAEHGGLLHRGLLYEELIGVPLIVMGPNIERGRVDDRLVSTVDIAPTLLGCAGLEIPEEMQGRDLLCSEPRNNPSETYVISQYGRNLYAVRTSDWKLVVESDPISVRLFDLGNDPGERHDVAERYPEEVDSLRSQLQQWRALQRATEGGEPVDLDPEEVLQLRALGYLGGSD